MFEECLKENKDQEFLFVERKGKWISWTWEYFATQINYFAKAVISIGVEPYQTVNILGFNSPEWFTAFMGGIYACAPPVGIYLTNNSEACGYVTEHSACGVLVVDSEEQYHKYDKILGKLKSLKAIILAYEIENDEVKKLLNPYVTIYTWKDFLQLGKKATVDLEFQRRINMQKPGNCCNVVYTSGTTGNPKAVLLSHDNITFTVRSLKERVQSNVPDRQRVVSYLPLSHIAGQIFDIFSKFMLIFSKHVQQKLHLFCSS